jgi:ABC-type multidrug transport system fused ATPase/permease subunit
MFMIMITGRTGAGKSSLANALFRIVECQPGSAIEIDGVDILKIGLDDLRKKLAIIPQEPTLFQGTIRSNIDPFNEYTDVQIWAALEQCHLSEFVQSTSAKLQHEITASGSNLSVGQRQLLCLARALLRQAKVILLDECTANVDYETDAAIQDTMQAGFGHCTRLCIAHRLQTVCNFDLILVLGAGKVLEFDTPIALLRNKESTFHGMCQQTGDLRNLIRLAEEAHTARESKQS